MEKINRIIECLDKAKLDDIRIYDLKNTNPFFNYVIIASASNKRQLQASISYIQEEKIEYNHVEGKNSTEWVLIDSADILVNIFSKNARYEYKLDDMYNEYLVKRD